MFCDTIELFADNLTLTRVNPSANLNAELLNRVGDRPAATDCAPDHQKSPESHHPRSRSRDRDAAQVAHDQASDVE